MLYLPHNIPCAEALRSQGFVVSEVALGQRVESARPILLLNLMPEKAACELQIARMVAPVSQDEDLQIIPVKIPGQTYKTTPMEHMEAFYEDICPLTFGGFAPESLLIITGAPLENVAYEDVRYWQQICEIFDWAAAGGVSRTLNLCWAAFAALYHHYGVPTHHLESKRFGVYPQAAVEVSALRDMAPSFSMPVSRHIELRREDILPHVELDIVAESPESGPGVIVDSSKRMTHITGHLEYEPERLHFEYKRDLSRGLSIQPALYYYNNGVPEAENIDFSWREAGLAFYRNFLQSL